MSFTGPFEDRFAIRELYDAYADAASRLHPEDWLACWTPDAAWITPLGEVRGTEQLAALWAKVGETYSSIGFFSAIGATEVTGDRATGRCHIREITLARDGALGKIVGRYHDELVRQDGTWRFARREYIALIREGTAG